MSDVGDASSSFQGRSAPAPLVPSAAELTEALASLQAAFSCQACASSLTTPHRRERRTLSMLLHDGCGHFFCSDCWKNKSPSKHATTISSPSCPVCHVPIQDATKHVQLADPLFSFQSPTSSASNDGPFVLMDTISELLRLQTERESRPDQEISHTVSTHGELCGIESCPSRGDSETTIFEHHPKSGDLNKASNEKTSLSRNNEGENSQILQDQQTDAEKMSDVQLSLSKAGEAHARNSFGGRVFFGNETEGLSGHYASGGFGRRRRKRKAGTTVVSMPPKRRACSILNSTILNSPPTSRSDDAATSAKDDDPAKETARPTTSPATGDSYVSPNQGVFNFHSQSSLPDSIDKMCLQPSPTVGKRHKEPITQNPFENNRSAKEDETEPGESSSRSIDLLASSEPKSSIARENTDPAQQLFADTDGEQLIQAVDHLSPSRDSSTESSGSIELISSINTEKPAVESTPRHCTDVGGANDCMSMPLISVSRKLETLFDSNFTASEAYSEGMKNQQRKTSTESTDACSTTSPLRSIEQEQKQNSSSSMNVIDHSSEESNIDRTKTSGSEEGSNSEMSKDMLTQSNNIGLATSTQFPHLTKPSSDGPSEQNLEGKMCKTTSIRLQDAYHSPPYEPSQESLSSDHPSPYVETGISEPLSEYLPSPPESIRIEKIAPSTPQTYPPSSKPQTSNCRSEQDVSQTPSGVSTYIPSQNTKDLFSPSYTEHRVIPNTIDTRADVESIVNHFGVETDNESEVQGTILPFDRDRNSSQHFDSPNVHILAQHGNRRSHARQHSQLEHVSQKVEESENECSSSVVLGTIPLPKAIESPNFDILGKVVQRSQASQCSQLENVSQQAADSEVDWSSSVVLGTVPPPKAMDSPNSNMLRDKVNQRSQASQCSQLENASQQVEESEIECSSSVALETVPPPKVDETRMSPSQSNDRIGHFRTLRDTVDVSRNISHYSLPRSQNSESVRFGNSEGTSCYMREGSVDVAYSASVPLPETNDFDDLMKEADEIEHQRNNLLQTPHLHGQVEPEVRKKYPNASQIDKPEKIKAESATSTTPLMQQDTNNISQVTPIGTTSTTIMLQHDINDIHKVTPVGIKQISHTGMVTASGTLKAGLLNHCQKLPHIVENSLSVFQLQKLRQLHESGACVCLHRATSTRENEDNDSYATHFVIASEHKPSFLPNLQRQNAKQNPFASNAKAVFEPTVKVCERTFEYLKCVALGIPVVDFSWIEESIDTDKWGNTTSHEICCDSSIYQQCSNEATQLRSWTANMGLSIISKLHQPKIPFVLGDVSIFILDSTGDGSFTDSLFKDKSIKCDSIPCSKASVVPGRASRFSKTEVRHAYHGRNGNLDEEKTEN
eukprot:scaffold151124_cov55-Attheya_sp.AAC.4